MVSSNRADDWLVAGVVFRSSAGDAPPRSFEASHDTIEQKRMTQASIVDDVGSRFAPARRGALAGTRPDDLAAGGVELMGRVPMARCTGGGEGIALLLERA